MVRICSKSATSSKLPAWLAVSTCRHHHCFMASLLHCFTACQETSSTWGMLAEGLVPLRMCHS